MKGERFSRGTTRRFFRPTNAKTYDLNSAAVDRPSLLKGSLFCLFDRMSRRSRALCSCRREVVASTMRIHFVLTSKFHLLCPDPSISLFQTKLEIAHTAIKKLDTKESCLYFDLDATLP